jgi:hypothetical protein
MIIKRERFRRKLFVSMFEMTKAVQIIIIIKV